MRVLEEDLGPAQLVVRLAQHLLADLVARLPAVHLVRRGTAVDKVPGYVLLNTRVVHCITLYNVSRDLSNRAVEISFTLTP